MLPFENEVSYFEDEDDMDDAKSTNSNYSAQSAPANHQKRPKAPKKHLKVDDYFSKALPSSGDEEDEHNLSFNGSNRSSFNGPSHIPAQGAYAKLTKKERREFRTAFRLFDKNDDGAISVGELKEVFEGLNLNFKDRELVLMLKSIDDNDDGKVDIDEFVAVMKGSAYSDPIHSRTYLEELKEAFEVFDKDGDGKINDNELKSIMHALGEKKLVGPDILDMIAMVDDDNDGCIDFEEFKKLMEEDTMVGYNNAPSSNAKHSNSSTENEYENDENDDEKYSEDSEYSDI